MRLADSKLGKRYTETFVFCFLSKNINNIERKKK